MEKPYAKVGDDGVHYSGPPTASSNQLKIAVFGPKANEIVSSLEARSMLDTLAKNGRPFSLIAVPSDTSWGTASTALVRAVYHDQALGIIALDRNSSHLAEQIGVKAFVPVIAIASDKMLTSTNIPWIFRLDEGAGLTKAIELFAQAEKSAGPNRGKIREVLASGMTLAGMSFRETGELR
jgi:hypothetical protein